MNGVVYEIRCKDINVLDSYIGSTCDFKQRKRLHKHDCNNTNSKGYNYHIYIFMRENGGFNNFEFHILEEVEYENRIELLKRERYWIENKKSSLNIQLPLRTKKEYSKQYDEINKERKKEYHKEYYEINKEHKKQYYEINKEHKKQYYEKNKEKIECAICCSIMRRDGLLRHQKTKKCKKFTTELA